MTWPLVKDDIKGDIARLGRLKSFFILATTSDNTVLCKELYLKVCAVDRRLQHQESAQERKEASEVRQTLKRWLAPYDPYQLYEKSLEIFQLGTGEWFLDGIFQDWIHQCTEPILWLRAKPGTGKTTLLSAAVKRIQDQQILIPDSKCLVYLFCSFTEHHSQDPRNVLGSLVIQLCEAVPRLWENVENQYLKRKGQSPQEPKMMESREIEQLLIQTTRQLPETLVILDAVNESKQSSKILQSLVELLLGGGSTRILMSSTEDLSPTFSPRQIIVITMKQAKTAEDIGRYIQAWLEDDDKLHDLPKALKEDIKRTLQRRNDGVFRWVRCQSEALRNQQTPQDIRNALRNVPGSLQQTYREILARIPDHHSQTAKQTLFWLVFAQKLMILKELCEAIVVVDEDDIIINNDVRLLRKKALVEICGSLISYDINTTKVTLAHSSVFEFLTSEAVKTSDMEAYFLDEDAAQGSIARRCLAYMSLPIFSSGYCPTHDTLLPRQKEWPLLTYIAEALSDHLHYVKLDDHMGSILLRFFATHRLPRGGNFGAWVQALMPAASNNIKNSTPLYYAARFGLVHVVKMILDTGERSDLELRGERQMSTPLQVAS